MLMSRYFLNREYCSAIGGKLIKTNAGEDVSTLLQGHNKCKQVKEQSFFI